MDKVFEIINGIGERAFLEAYSHRQGGQTEGTGQCLAVA